MLLRNYDQIHYCRQLLKVWLINWTVQNQKEGNTAVKSTGGCIPLGTKPKWKLTPWCCCVRLGLPSVLGFIKQSRVLSSLVVCNWTRIIQGPGNVFCLFPGLLSGHLFVEVKVWRQHCWMSVANTKMCTEFILNLVWPPCFWLNGSLPNLTGNITLLWVCLWA